MSKFKVCDIVRVVNYGEPAEGQIGIVTKVSGWIHVELPIIEESDGTYRWLFTGDELEAVNA